MGAVIMADFVTDRAIPANGNCQPDTWASTIAAISEQLTEPLTKLAHVPASAKKKFDCEGVINDWISTVLQDSSFREEFKILTWLIKHRYRIAQPTSNA
jgi:hypothetical protein